MAASGADRPFFVVNLDGKRAGDDLLEKFADDFQRQNRLAGLKDGRAFGFDADRCLQIRGVQHHARFIGNAKNAGQRRHRALRSGDSFGHGPVFHEFVLGDFEFHLWRILSFL